MTRLALAERSLERDEQQRAAVHLIRACEEVYNNSSTASEDMALSAIRAGRGAYWSNSRERTALAFLDLANVADLPAALEFAAREVKGPGAWTVYGLVASLIPLNKTAARDVAAYWS